MPIASINGTIIYYETKGEGLPIVFVHPPLLTGANFRYQQAQLSDEFQVVTFDIRGHGRSGKSKAPLSYSLIAEDIKQLLDHLDIRQAVICGYSTGGTVALEAVLTYPDRFLGCILVSSMPEASDFVLKTRIRLAAGLSRWKPTFALLRAAITWGNADSRLTFRNLLRDAKRGDRANIRQYYRISLDFAITRRLREVSVPVLLLYGKKDHSFFRYMRMLEQELPSCELHVLEGEKHQLPTKAAAKMNERIRSWLAPLALQTGHSGQRSERLRDRVPESALAAEPAEHAEGTEPISH